MTDAGTSEMTPTVEAERERAFRELANGVPSGGLTLGEYAERATAIQEASASEEIESALRGLPEEAAGAPPTRLGRWIVAVLGGTEQRGRWRLGHQLRVVCAFGGATLDLSAAEVEAPESTITVFAILGGAELIAPQGVSIQLGGFSLLGGKGDQRMSGPLLPGSPLVRVRAFTFLGGITVKEPKTRRNLLELIRARRTKPADS